MKYVPECLRNLPPQKSKPTDLECVMKNETFTPERIKAEADAFFEWDGEDRSLVTTTSCLLFAQHIAGLMQARAAQPAPVVPEGSIYVECRQCDKCQHVGINDAAHGLAACHDCDWSGNEPEDDKCPGCKSENCMAAACPECGARYALIASEDVAAAPAQGQQVDSDASRCKTIARLMEMVSQRDAELSALKAQQVGQESEPAPKQHPDDAAVDRFAAAMKAKLARSREKGRHGWQNCTAPHLSAMLYDHLYKADPLDVGNFAMMLHQNGQAIELPFEARGRHTAPQPAPAQDVAGLPFVQKVIEKLRRFDECAEDFESGGVDIGREWLGLLTKLRLLARVQRSPALWEMTEQGFAALAAHDRQSGGEE